MAKLPSEAQALVDAGRAALRPTNTDRERVLEALQARMGLDASAGASTGTAVPTPPAAAAGLSWPTLAMVAIGLGIGGGVAYQTFANAPPAVAVTTNAPAPPAPPAPPPVPEAAPPLPAAPATTAATEPNASETRAAAPRGPGRLAEEVEILSRAQTELHAGRFTSSLRLLEEHARKFPRGKLTQERVAARIQALCGAGRQTEANAELARLSPGSLHEGRAREACATGAKK